MEDLLMNKQNFHPSRLELILEGLRRTASYTTNPNIEEHLRNQGVCNRNYYLQELSKEINSIKSRIDGGDLHVSY